MQREFNIKNEICSFSYLFRIQPTRVARGANKKNNKTQQNPAVGAFLIVLIKRIN